ncbi:MAG TPA: NrfD/PsrC family molybdoenzyme membrane anchor subunit, partial [Dermatophilaceae bacterium]
MTSQALTTHALTLETTTLETTTTNAREASLRPFGKPSRLWWLTILALTLVVLTGIAAWVLQLRGGMGVAGYSDQAFWAIYIADVVTFIGVSYGGAVVSAILRLTGATWRAPLTRLAEGTAVVTVLIGAALIIPHIANPIRLFELVTRPNLSAPVFWDFVAVHDLHVRVHRLLRPPARTRHGSPARGTRGAPRPTARDPVRLDLPRLGRGTAPTARSGWSAGAGVHHDHPVGGVGALGPGVGLCQHQPTVVAREHLGAAVRRRCPV